ncbi:hypothetical protein [Aristophania vespae]|uniref:hypothetical protein n=1 Tax=Aristophania vespae TaxID=2697033 RepID=UPI0023514765|nr:hypothetical protein [Aristophania vespae]UMM63557.1 hypothetical protein DM15PD_05310 [Aristophania vespae]
MNMNNEENDSKMGDAGICPGSPDNQDIQLVSAVFDKISDQGGENLIAQLSQGNETVDDIVDKIALSDRLEVRKKHLLTDNTMETGFVSADFSYVGLNAEIQALGFHNAFNQHIRPRLGKRADGFSVIFDVLRQQERPVIVETGCLRVPNNWEGDGQSTFLFDWFAREMHGTVFTIDINAASIDSARRACSGTTNTILNDSRAGLHTLGQITSRAASLLYLDSFDLDISAPMPSAIHHATEMMAARRLISEGTLICVDDFNVPPLGEGGKGMIIDQFMSSIGAEVLYSGYQKIWRV